MTAFRATSFGSSRHKQNVHGIVSGLSCAVPGLSGIFLRFIGNFVSVFPLVPNPDLPFLAFLENGKENHQKNKDSLSLANP